jgi:tetratricopeptide (TPR) repeat protein
MKNGSFALLAVLLASTLCFAQSGRKKIMEGNKLFAEERYDEAQNKYRDAQVNDPESPLLKFNIGDTQYKKKKYEEALKEFESSLSTDDVLFQSGIFYNQGNTLYRMGKLPESILAYKKALELNPDDEDAKYNLEFVRQQLKDQAQKQQQDPQQQQQQQQEQQQQQQQQDQEEQEQQQQQQEQEQQQEQGEEEEQQPQEQPAQPEEMSEEDAERILEALKEDQENMKDARKQKVSGRANVSKDW